MRYVVLCAAMATFGFVTPSQATEYGIAMDPYAGYLDTTVVIRSTIAPCPDGSTSLHFHFVWARDAPQGPEGDTKVAADGSWRWEGKLWAQTLPGRYTFIANCLNPEGVAANTYSGVWYFTVKDGAYWLDGMNPPPPRPKPTTPRPSPRPTTPLPTTRPPTSPPTTEPPVTPTPTEPEPTPSESPSPTEPPATSAPPTVTLVTTDDDELNALAVGGVAGGGTLAALSGVVWIRRRRAASLDGDLHTSSLEGS